MLSTVQFFYVLRFQAHCKLVRKYLSSKGGSQRLNAEQLLDGVTLGVHL